MKELISINLFRTSKENVRKFCKKYGLSDFTAGELLEDKANGIATLWLELSDKIRIVSFTRSVNEKKIIFQNDEMKAKYGDMLDQFPKYNPRKDIESKKVFESDIKVVEEDNFTVDDILDKISNLGMGSLTKKEMEFLKSQSE